ncbi:VWA domain-containing protein [Streptomyces sp. NPDC057682]|uniref:VWA domain-containing protein n=1 Tax=Streptomyces sp. NPDC057682 TaxID=3346210 RepID=UPI003678050E
MNEAPETAELIRRAGPWLARSSAPAEHRTAAVLGDDPFDTATRHETFERATALRELAAELEARHPGAADLLADVFTAAHAARPRLRAREAMDPARLPHHAIVAALLETPAFRELRGLAAGDPCAAALAVLALAPELRRILEQTGREQDLARRAREAERHGAEAATAVADALREAVGGAAPAGADAEAVHRAVRAAERADRVARASARDADRALTAVVPGIRAAARTATERAVTAARTEAALLRAWGVGAAEKERLPFDQRLRLARRMGTGRLARWADLIGRFRQMAEGERSRKVSGASGELVGVTLGDDLSRVVPSELAHLGLPALRAVFAARHAAGELMLYDHRGERATGRGAIIVCVDTSHSMYEAGPGGVTREAWAKACALALFDQARHARRDFAGILFSSPGRHRVFRFPAGEPAATADVMEFAETFLGGGTSYETPLGAAAELLDREHDRTGRAHGDIVMITDDECAVTEEWLRDWRTTRRRLGFRVFGVAVGAPHAAGEDSVLDRLCDNLRAVEDLTDVRAAAGLFRLI